MRQTRKQRLAWGSALVGAGVTLAILLATGVGAGTAGAAPSAATAPRASGDPTNTSPPTITGTPQEGQTLVGHRGTWTGDPTDYNDYWVRCDKNGGSCANISGATDRTGYTLTSADVGNTIRFKVRAKNSSGTTFATSVPTAVIKAASSTPAPSNTGCPKASSSIQVSNISSPARLTIDQTQITPSTVTFSTDSITVRLHVTGCGGSVAGALVYAAAVPYNQFSVPNEQPTDANGWATLQMTRLGGYPASPKQQLLVVFARARKPGDPLLGGISTRRLVSFHVTHG